MEGEVAATLGDSFPNHGGVFYWAASGDSNGAWPAYVHQEQGSHASTDSSSSSPGGASQPTAQPTAQPTPGTSTSSSACLGEWASCTDSSSCCQEGLPCWLGVPERLVEYCSYRTWLLVVISQAFSH